MPFGPEYEYVEKPLIDQLVAMGWEYVEGNADDPAATGRESFRQVLLRDDLETALRRSTGTSEARNGSIRCGSVRRWACRP